MASAAPVIFILGAGSNVGAAVSKLFAQNGYKIALASRRLTDGPGSDGSYNVQVDLAHPETVSKAFEKVTSALGPPGVVVYNGRHPRTRTPIFSSLVTFAVVLLTSDSRGCNSCSCK
jgi:NAD(P)-dependent dehydrogenase (short-subunit alcohol dehydrogenase family)